MGFLLNRLIISAKKIFLKRQWRDHEDVWKEMLSTLQFGLGHVFIHTSSGVVNSLAQATPKDLHCQSNEGREYGEV